MSGPNAYVRHFQVIVPPDAVAHIDADLGKAALRMMDCNMAAELTPTAKCLGRTRMLSCVGLQFARAHRGRFVDFPSVEQGGVTPAGHWRKRE